MLGERSLWRVRFGAVTRDEGAHVGPSPTLLLCGRGPDCQRNGTDTDGGSDDFGLAAPPHRPADLVSTPHLDRRPSRPRVLRQRPRRGTHRPRIEHRYCTPARGENAVATRLAAPAARAYPDQRGIVSRRTL